MREGRDMEIKRGIELNKIETNRKRKTYIVLVSLLD